MHQSEVWWVLNDLYDSMLPLDLLVQDSIGHCILVLSTVDYQSMNHMDRL
jgi:hypothetical protein